VVCSRLRVGLGRFFWAKHRWTDRPDGARLFGLGPVTCSCSRAVAGCGLLRGWFRAFVSASSLASLAWVSSPGSLVAGEAKELCWVLLQCCWRLDWRLYLLIPGPTSLPSQVCSPAAVLACFSLAGKASYYVVVREWKPYLGWWGRGEQGDLLLAVGGGRSRVGARARCSTSWTTRTCAVTTTFV